MDVYIRLSQKQGRELKRNRNCFERAQVQARQWALPVANQTRAKEKETYL